MEWTVADALQQKPDLNAKQQMQWVQVAVAAQKSCLIDGGDSATCKLSAVRQANGVVSNTKIMQTAITANLSGLVKKKYNGKMYLVAPVVMLVPGVHNGSEGPALYLAEELEKFPESWNGIPVSLGHPKIGDNFVSCNYPEVMTDWCVGRVWNVAWEDNKLKGEVWIDIERIKELSPGALDMIQSGQPVDVSTGLWSDDELKPGTWNGDAYDAVVRNIRPDHLALLPNSEGACNWEDGCGIRANKLEKGIKPKGKERKRKPTKKKENKMKRGEVIAILIANDAALFDAEDQGWLEDMEDDEFERVLAVAGYCLDGKPCDKNKKKVRGNEPAPKTYTKEELATLIAAGIEDKIKADDEETKVKAAEAKAEEERKKALADGAPKTFEELMASAPADVKEIMERDLARNKREKEDMIKALTDDKACPYTEKELETKSIDDLEKLTALAGIVKKDFSAQDDGRGGGGEIKKNERQGDGTGVPEMPTLNFDTK